MKKLFIVPTPIGNLKDITFRAIEILNSVDFILAEDTRKSKILLKHYNINIPIKSYHMHNEHSKTKGIIKLIEKGIKIAIISDAGTPSISDPGFYLVREALTHNIKVECLPGATAIIPAIVQSGFPNDRFVFEGFLPKKKGRKSRIQSLVNERRTIVFFESPHKLLKTLFEFNSYFGPNCRISISRELTKIYEETFIGTIKESLVFYSNKKIKGEFVICISSKNNLDELGTKESC